MPHYITLYFIITIKTTTIMSQAIKFHRVASGSTPVGGWVKGHVYFIYNTGGTGSLKLVKDDNGTLEDYTQADANTHTHTSSQITSMAGYTKASSSGAITASDTLNQAIGKLEKTIDDIEYLLSLI